MIKIRDIRIDRYNSNIEVYAINSEEASEMGLTRIWTETTDADSIPSASYVPTISYIKETLADHDIWISRDTAKEIKMAIYDNSYLAWS